MEKNIVLSAFPYGDINQLLHLPEYVTYLTVLLEPFTHSFQGLNCIFVRFLIQRLFLYDLSFHSIKFSDTYMRSKIPVSSFS